MSAETEAPPFWIFLGGWLNEHDWSQARFADEVGVYQTVVGRWLHADPRRRARPGQKTLPRLAEVLGVPVQELVVMLIADQTRATQTDAVGRTRLASRSGAFQDQYERWIAAVGPGNEDYFWQHLKAQGDSTAALIRRMQTAVSDAEQTAVNDVVKQPGEGAEEPKHKPKRRLSRSYRSLAEALNRSAGNVSIPAAA